MRPATRKAVLFRLLTIGLPVVVAGILFEAGLRQFAREPRFDAEIEAQADQARTDSIWIASEDPVLVYVHRQNYTKDGVRLTESHGILSRQEISLHKAPDTFRVVVLGDSVAAREFLAPGSKNPSAHAVPS